MVGTFPRPGMPGGLPERSEPMPLPTGLLNGNPQQGGQQPKGLLGVNQGVVDWLRRPITTNEEIAPSGQQSLAQGWTEGMGLPPWATTEQINNAPGQEWINWLADHGNMSVPDGQGGRAGFGRDDILRAAFPHYGASAGNAGGAGGGGAGGAASGSLEQRFPHSAGKFPLKPFEPIPAGLPYQQTRDIISTGGLPQGTEGSKPSQALEAMEWLRSKIATIKR